MKNILPTLLASALGLTVAAEGAVPAIELKVKPEREVLVENGPRETVVQVEIRAKPSDKKRTTPINLALVLDRSGSMAGAKIEKARQAAAVAVDQLDTDDYFSLVVYDDEVEVLIPPQKVKDKEAVKRQIYAIRPGGSTALYAGVEKGAGQVRKYLDPEKVNRLILLSDGLANVGPSSPGDLARLGKELRGEGLSVSTIGLGEDYNEDLMTALAEASHANYYYVQDAEKLPEIFTQELGTVKSVAGRNVQVIITLPEGVKPIRIIGEDEFAFKGQTATLPLSEFSAAQTRRFLISCEAPKVKDAEIALAQVELNYVDAESRQAVREIEKVTVRQSPDEAASQDSIQAEVLANRAITENRLAKERAVKLADAGKAEEAARVLETQHTINASLPAAAQSERLQQEQSELKAKSSELQNNGSLSKISRKAIQYDNYRDKTQKR
ncbi:MAG TPA: VWA domain-containing protein [Chthoniobacterales bacterium]